MKQKFKKLTFVKVADEMPPYMSHFDKGFIGIVDGTYSQIYTGNDIYSYALFKIENEKIVNRISWYNEELLTELPEQDRERAEEMIEAYHLDN
jgi:hypothetical protein